MEVTQFTATLYYRNDPEITAQNLIEAWAMEGYTCDMSEEFDAENELFNGLRGGTYVLLEKSQPIKKSEVPEFYPEVAEVDLNYDDTYLINPRRAFDDFQAAHYQIELLFRIVEDLDEPRIAHNEWAAVLLGIFQVAPIDAICFHEIGVLIPESVS